MMTVHRLSAGDGYAYYIRETVSADTPRRGSELGDYYTANGQPPGAWTGSGTALLGVSGTVTEVQMRALFGEGLHPDAEAVVAARIAAGDTAKQALAAAKLGRAYPRYKEPDGEFGRLLDEELAAFERLRGRPPTSQEHAALRGKAGVRLFVRQHGRRPATKEELGRFIKKAEAGRRQSAVAGFDLVFSASKSISVLWALGDAEVRRAVERAHGQAIADTLAWLEAEATMTRTGTGGVAQEHVDGGLIAARFRHYENRLGEPMLHDHVVVANKVRGRDGRWRSLDSALLYAQAVAASELYNARVVEEVCAELGLRAEAREVTPGKRPVMEIAGVGTDLIEGHSQRSKGIKERVAELIREYREEHGREPSSKALTALMQQATLDTRPDKEHARSLFDLRTAWRAAAVEAFGAERVDGLLQGAQEAAAGFREDVAALRIDIETAAREVVETVSEYRSVWGRRQVLAEARRWVMNATRGTRPGAELAEQIAARALAVECLDITPPDPNPRFDPLTRDDGESIYRRREAGLYTSTAVLAAEDRIVAAARTLVIPSASAEVYERVEAAYQRAHPDRPLDAGQRALARAFATGEHLVEAAIGPAGAGKTTAMALAAEAVRAAGGRVIGLGPSARAAAELAAGIDAPAYVLHEWSARREGAHEGLPMDPGFELFPGDLVIVDEAGMAGSRRLAAVIADARRAGALVRLVGDPGQLASVESGGALRLLAAMVDVVELESVHRFRVQGEAAASLALRGGEAEDAWAWYLDQGRIVAGSREQMVHRILADWQRDIEAGLTAMMMADDNATVAELNAMAQAHRLATGRLDTSCGVDLRDGLQAHGGDLVVTRKNARKNVVRGGKDFVKNGDQWSVVRVTEDGALVVRHTGHGGQATLPAEYVRKYVELGYASTGHRGQGATVDTGGGLFSTSTARESAYVEMTRGRQENRGYVILEDGQTMADVLQAIARNSQASRSATDTIREEWDRAWGVRQLANEYTDVHARALSLRYESMLRNVLGEAAEAFIAADAWPAVVRAVRDAERKGFAPERILSAAYHERDFHDADDVSAVLSWRIDNHVEDVGETVQRLQEQHTRRPLANLTGEQLDSLAGRATARRSQALEELKKADARVASQPKPLTVDGLPVPAWPNRRHGDLTSRRLADAIGSARRTWRLAVMTGDRDAARETYRELHALRQEQRTRARMSRRDRARETWQREPGRGHASTAGLDGATTAAVVRANHHRQDEAIVRLRRAEAIEQRVRAEQRLREILPDGPPPASDHGGPVPEWLAERTVERDQHTPPAWIDHLRKRRAVIEESLRRTGQALAEDPPAWARGLGPVPARDHELREAWESAAALADAWRTRRQVRDSEPGLGDRPEDERDARAWQTLHDQVAAVGRRAHAVDAAARRGEALYPAPGPLLTDALEPVTVDPEPVELAPAEDVEPVSAGEAAAETPAEATSVEPDTAPVLVEPVEEQDTTAVVEWQDLPYATWSDVELTAAMAHAAEAAEAAYQQATAQDARAAELDAALVPGGEVERRVTERAERVEAILRMRQAAERILDLEAGADQADQQASGLEERLARTAMFGRPAVRGADREALDRRLTAVREASVEHTRKLTEARRQLADATARAGDPADHGEVLASWQRAGGTRETVLTRMTASRRRSLRAAWDEAKAAWGRWEGFHASVTAIRQEMNRRDAQPCTQRAAEDARRIQAAQQLAAEQQRRQQGPDVNRGGRGRGGPEPQGNGHRR